MAVPKLKKKRRSIYTLLVVLVVLAGLVGFIVSMVTTQSSLSEMKAELKTIQDKTIEIEAENVELQRILEDDDMNAYMEKVAIEEMNYAYPNERRYYDTSRN